MNRSAERAFSGPDEAIALESLLYWGRAQGRSYHEMLPVVNQRFSPASVAKSLRRLAPQLDGLRAYFETL